MTDKKDSSFLAQFLTNLAQQNANKPNANASADSVTGELSRPATQEIDGNTIVWRWNAIDGDLSIHFHMPTQEWAIMFKGIEFTLYEAKVAADALLSAYQWEKVWKTYFADYFIQEVVPMPEVPEPEFFEDVLPPSPPIVLDDLNDWNDEQN
jgi:hypothetical protein